MSLLTRLDAAYEYAQKETDDPAKIADLTQKRLQKSPSPYQDLERGYRTLLDMESASSYYEQLFVRRRRSLDDFYDIVRESGESEPRRVVFSGPNSQQTCRIFGRRLGLS